MFQGTGVGWRMSLIIQGSESRSECPVKQVSRNLRDSDALQNSKLPKWRCWISGNCHTLLRRYWFDFLVGSIGRLLVMLHRNQFYSFAVGHYLGPRHGPRDLCGLLLYWGGIGSVQSHFILIALCAGLWSTVFYKRSGSGEGTRFQ